MTLLNRFTAWCLRRAAIGWPVAPDEQLREWQAELDVLRRDPASGPLRRAWAQLRFAGSLMLGRSDGYRIVADWRASAPESLRRVLLLIALGFVAVAAAKFLTDPVVVWLIHTGLTWAVGSSGDPRESLPSIAVAFHVVALPLLSMKFAALAWGLGRRLPLLSFTSGRLGVRTAAAAVSAIGMLSFVAWRSVFRPLDPQAFELVLTASLTWVASTTVLSVVVVRLHTTGRRRTAIVAGIAGVLLVVESTMSATAAVFARSGVGLGFAPGWVLDVVTMRWLTAGGPRQGAEYAPLDNTASYLSELTVLTVVALMYQISAQRSAHPAGQVDYAGALGRDRRSIEAPRPALPITTVVVGLVVYAIAAIAWAYSSAVLTPRMRILSTTSPAQGTSEELLMWVADLRWAAILLAGIGLLLAAADRRAATLAASLLIVVLLVTDGALERLGAIGATGFRIAATVAALTVGIAWWIAGRQTHQRGAEVVRRRLAVGAVGAALCAPTLIVQSTSPENGSVLPIGLSVLTVALPGVFVVAAAVAAATARLRPLPAAAIVAAAAAAVALLTAYGVLSSNTSWQAAGLLFAGPLAVSVAALLGRDQATPDRRLRTRLVWTAIMIVSVPASVPMMYAALIASFFGAELLFVISGSSYQVDGVAIVPGMALIAFGVGVAVAMRAVRRATVSRQPLMLPSATAAGSRPSTV